MNQASVGKKKKEKKPKSWWIEHQKQLRQRALNVIHQGKVESLQRRYNELLSGVRAGDQRRLDMQAEHERLQVKETELREKMRVLQDEIDILTVVGEVYWPFWKAAIALMEDRED